MNDYITALTALSESPLLRFLALVPVLVIAGTVLMTLWSSLKVATARQR